MIKKNNIIFNSENLLKSLSYLSESELSDLLIYHNKKYFLENDPEITDEAFDKIVEALKFKNKNAKALLEIGYKRNFYNIITHEEPMLSLEKCYDDAEFFKWAEKINSDLIVMPKIDGVACNLIYENNHLKLAATRGDGKTGEDITANINLIKDIPSTLEYPHKAKNNISVRGEIFLPLSQFKDNFSEEFSSPRNLAAGFLKLKNPDKNKSGCLKFFPYDIRGLNLDSEKEKFELLKYWQFSMMPWFCFSDHKKALELYLNFFRERELYDFELDGVVFRANLISEQIRLGETTHHPRYALAYKFHSESAPTKLIKVEWSIARSGAITPVAHFEPVFISNASIQKASLHNLGIFKSLDLHEYSLVEINRRGGVIPHLERVLSTKGKKLSIPDKCPSCLGEVVIDGDFLLCKNKDNCHNVIIAKLLHFCHTLQIDGLGEKIIKRLVDKKIIFSRSDIFRLDIQKLMSLERMGKILAQKLLKEINNKRQVKLEVFIRSLGIHEIGINMSNILAQNWPSINELKNLTKNDLLSIHGVGENIASAFIDGIKKNSNDIDDLLTEMSIIENELPNVDIKNELFQKTVLFTGKMAHIDRKKAQQSVRKLGGKTPDTMSKQVDYLVIGDNAIDKKSTKQIQAENLIKEGFKINIISESEFLKMIHSTLNL